MDEVASPAEVFDTFTSFVRRQYQAIVFVLTLASALGAYYIVSTPPTFTARATLLIEPKAQIFEHNSTSGAITPIDPASVESQVEILKSEEIALSVIKELKLAEDSEFVGSEGGLVGAFFGLFQAHEPRSEFGLSRRAMRTFERRLAAKRVGLTYVIDITFWSHSAEQAAQIANAIADAYVVGQIEATHQASIRASAWMQERMSELAEQTSNAERAVVDFKTNDTGRRLMNEPALGELNSQLLSARGGTSEARSRFDRITGVIRADTPDATVIDTLGSELLSKLRSQYLELSKREADSLTRYGEDHPDVLKLRNKLLEIRRSIFEELRRLAESSKSDYELAKLREESIQKQLIGVEQIVLSRLESKAKTYRALHDNFLQRYTESVQQQSIPISEARVISRASPPLTKSPQALMVFAITTAAGTVVGLAIAMLRDVSDRVFRTGAQVEAALEADCIAVLPILKDGHIESSVAEGWGQHAQSFWGFVAGEFRPAVEPATAPRSNKESGCPPKDQLGPPPQIVRTQDVRQAEQLREFCPRTIVRAQGPIWTLVNEPLSSFAGEIRSIKLAADLNRLVKPRNVLGFTSSLPNEGKSTVAASFAQLLALGGARVILADCDLRRPSLSRILAPNAGVGILELIAGRAVIEETVWTDPLTKMDFLPAVIKTCLPNSSELLASEAARTLFGRLRHDYDYVVVDLSESAPMADVRATSRFVDSYVYIIEWGRTKIDVVGQAAQNVHGNLLGAVLNKTDISRLGRYDGQRPHYYHNTVRRRML